MTADWVTAFGTVATFGVIFASAIAALRQLRHMRSGNAISLLTSYNAEFDTLEFQLAFAFVRSELPELIKQDSVIDELVQAPPFVGDYAKIRMIANFFEDLGAFVLTNLLDEYIVCTLYSENVTSAWRSIAPIAALLRRKIGYSGIWENFEYLARRGTEFAERHPNGVYPRGVARMPVDDTLIVRWETLRNGGR